MTVIMTAFEVAGLMVWDRKMETMPLQTRHRASRAPPFVIEAFGQRYRRPMQFIFLLQPSDLSPSRIYSFRAHIEVSRPPSAPRDPSCSNAPPKIKIC